ncbi:MAG: hypothetical protein ACXABY_17235, partial [Candidatus Thorarchaeota archaeon]
IASPLIVALLYAGIYNVDIPYSIIIPTTGGGLMNLGFWLFYKSSIKPIPELSKSLFGKHKDAFLFSSFLHLVAILILLTIDVRWIFELF